MPLNTSEDIDSISLTVGKIVQFLPIVIQSSDAIVFKVRESKFPDELYMQKFYTPLEFRIEKGERTFTQEKNHVVYNIGYSLLLLLYQ